MQQKSEAALVLGIAASISAASKLEATADAALSVRSGMPLFIFSLPLLSSPRTVFQFQREAAMAILLTRDHQLHLGVLLPCFSLTTQRQSPLNDHLNYIS